MSEWRCFFSLDPTVKSEYSDNFCFHSGGICFQKHRAVISLLVSARWEADMEIEMKLYSKHNLKQKLPVLLWCLDEIPPFQVLRVNLRSWPWVDGTCLTQEAPQTCPSHFLIGQMTQWNPLYLIVTAAVMNYCVVVVKTEQLGWLCSVGLTIKGESFNSFYTRAFTGTGTEQWTRQTDTSLFYSVSAHTVWGMGYTSCALGLFM